MLTWPGFQRLKLVESKRTYSLTDIMAVPAIKIREIKRGSRPKDQIKKPRMQRAFMVKARCILRILACPGLDFCLCERCEVSGELGPITLFSKERPDGYRIVACQ